jgi:Na+-translocating ferredoxin:NAD+ oxidoreductase RnfG subunit
MLIAVNNDLSVQDYKVVTHQETTGFGADIVDNDFNVSEIDDLGSFDAVAGVTKTSNAIKQCFTLVSERIVADLGGGLDE